MNSLKGLLDWRKNLKKRTIKREIFFEGVGLHTGEPSLVKLVPSESGKIIFFKGNHHFEAHYTYVMETRRGVVLGDRSSTVYTVEHLLSSLYGMGVDSVDVVFEKGAEPPAFDGSSLFFSEKIRESGLVEIDREVVFITAPHLEYASQNSSITLQSSGEDVITYFIEFKAPIGTQVYQAHLHDPEFYLENIAPARTFIFDFEVEKVKEMGLAKGGSPDNTVVFTQNGVYNGKLRFDNEPVRHKILDFIGDAALLGKRIKGSIFIKKAGHTEHIEFIRKLEEEHGI